MILIVIVQKQKLSIYQVKFVKANKNLVCHSFKHLWDILRRKINQGHPPIQTVAELETALHQEWALMIQ